MNTKERIFVPLIDDLLFKEALAHKDNRYFLEYLLETFLHLERGSLHKKLVVNYESVIEKKKYSNKAMRNDVLVTFDKYVINLEAYRKLTSDSVLKSTCYALYLFSNIDRSEEYTNLDNVIQLNFVNEVKEKEIVSSKINSNYEILEDEEMLRLLGNKLQIKYYRIDRMRTKRYNKNNLEERFLRFIGAKSSEERDEIAKGDEEFMAFNEWVDNYINGNNYQKRMQEWGERNAHKLGVSEGIERGIERGIEKTAKNMLEMDIPKDVIAKATGLSIKQIKML